MEKNKRESLMIAVVFAVAFPLLWSGLLLSQIFLPDLSRSEILSELISWTVYPVDQVANFLGVPGGCARLGYIFYLIAGELFFLACVGFCVGLLFAWGIRYIDNREQYNEK